MTICPSSQNVGLFFLFLFLFFLFFFFGGVGIDIVVNKYLATLHLFSDLSPVCTNKVFSLGQGYSTLKVTISNQLKTRGLLVRDFSLKTGVIQWEDQKRGWSHIVRIRQMFANFYGKIQIWTHFWQKLWKKNWGNVVKKVVHSVRDCQKLVVNYWKRVIGWERVKKGSMGESKLQKGDQCGRVFPSPIFSLQCQYIMLFFFFLYPLLCKTVFSN